jgi:ABC-2 type transport system permease protein
VSELRDLVRRRRLLRLMARQDVKSSFQNYRLGVIWALAEPFALALLIWVVFSFIRSGRAESIGLDPFVIYIVTGLLPFQWLVRCMNKGPKVYKRYGEMLMSSPLPVWVWPIRIVNAAGAEFLISIPVIFALMILFGASITWGIALLPVAILVQYLLGSGVAMLGAALGLRVPDVAYLFTVMSRVLFWTSPILWNGKDFPDPIQSWLYLNPFHFVLDLYRATIWPEALPSFRDAAISITVIAVIFITGSVLLKLRVNEVRRLVS